MAKGNDPIVYTATPDVVHSNITFLSLPASVHNSVWIRPHFVEQSDVVPARTTLIFRVMSNGVVLH